MRFIRKKYPQELKDEAFNFALKMKKQNYIIDSLEDVMIMVDIHKRIFECVAAYSSKSSEMQMILIFKDIVSFIKKFNKDYPELKRKYREGLL